MHAPLRALGLAAALFLYACRPSPPAPGSGGEAPNPRRSEREGYRPPSDGILTPPQVEAFLKVREETVKARRGGRPEAPLEGEEGISRAADSRSAEIRAARALAVPVDEYLWVRERVLEAEAAVLTAKLNADVLDLLGRTIASLAERRAAAPDEAARKLLDEQIESFEAEAARVRREAAEEEPASVRENLKVLAPWRRKISATTDELAQLRLSETPAPSPAPKKP